MTKEEALAKIEELRKFVEDCNKQIGFEDDRIFLLSTEEYEKYKDVINKFCPIFKCWWWLRSPGYNQGDAASVDFGGSVAYGGDGVHDVYGCVRPAIKFTTPLTSLYKIGETLEYKNYSFTVIDKFKNYFLAIASVPICTHRFDKEANDYEKSEIRKFLLDWMKK